MREPSEKSPDKSTSGKLSGPLVSLGTLVNVILAVFFIAVAIYSDSIIVMAFAAVIIIFPAIKRLVRGKSQAPLSAQGDGTSDDYRVENGWVYVTKGGKTWHKPLSSYEGVLWREQMSNFSSRKRRHYTSRIIELRHGTARAFDVNLYTARDDTGVRARWEEAAVNFNLPALRDMGDGKILRREVEDIGKSMRDLASEDRLDTSFDQGAPVPPGARWTHDGGVLEIDQRRAFWPCLLCAAPFVLFYLLVSYNLPFDTLFGVDGSLRPLFGVIAGIPAIVIGGLWILITYRIRVTPREVTVMGRLGPIPLWRQTLALDAVEEVLVDPSTVVWQSVLLENVQTTLRVWPLNKPSAEWLAQLLRSAIALAPGKARAGHAATAVPRD